MNGVSELTVDNTGEGDTSAYLITNTSRNTIIQ